METMIEVDSLYQGIDFSTKMTRAKFEHINIDLFEKCIEILNQMLTETRINKNDIHEVILVGGSTRIPRIKNLVSQYFDGKQITQSLNPEESVVCGAAIHCSILNNTKIVDTSDILLLDVTPLSIGIETAGGVMSTMIPRHTTIPTHRTQTFKTYQDNQTSLTIKVYEGERSLAPLNNLLLTFEVNDLPRGPAGDVSVDITFDIDANGILSVSSKENTTQKTQRVTYPNEKNRLSTSEIEKMLREAEYKQTPQVEEEVSRVNAKNHLESFLYNTLNKLKEKRFKVSDEENDKMRTHIKETIDWVDQNPNTTTNEYDKKYDEVQKIFKSKLGKNDIEQLEKPPVVPKYSGPTVEEVD